MAKVISQQTFDEVVRENMEEFDMSVDEALAEAVQQFESQGVNLLNIIRDPQLYMGAEGAEHKHAVVVAVEQLANILEETSLNEGLAKEQLQIICKECDIDLAHRCMAGKNHAYETLVKACKKTVSDAALLKNVLTTFIALCNGQPDLLDQQGLDLLREYLSTFHKDPEVITLVLRLIRVSCVMHEKNRQDFVERNLIRELVKLLDAHRQDSGVVKEVCKVMRVLTNDDDVRVPFGKAHEHAKMIVLQENSLQKILNIANDYKCDTSILGELFLTLAKLSVRDEFCAEIMDQGGVQLMIDTLENNVSHRGLVRQILVVLQTVAGNDNVKIAIVKANGAELILSAISKHQLDTGIAELGCAAISTIILRNLDNCSRVMAAGGAEVIMKAMQLHPDSTRVQQQGCMAVRCLVARTRTYCPEFLELGAEAIITKALRSHPTCQDVAKAALRDLDCKVELRELWKGESKGLAKD